MSTFAAALKQEIIRLARKEMKKTLLPLRSLTTRQRAVIAALKSEIRSLGATVVAAKNSPQQIAADVSDATVKKARFSPFLLARLRKNKKLSSLENM